MPENDKYGIEQLFEELELDVPSSQVMRKAREEEIPHTPKIDPRAIAEWANSRTTPDVQQGTIYEDLREIMSSIEPLLRLAYKIPRRIRNSAVLYRLAGEEICVRDIKRLRDVEMRVRLIKMAVERLEALVNSSTQPGFRNN